jgi:hypothetical protein
LPVFPFPFVLHVSFSPSPSSHLPILGSY